MGKSNKKARSDRINALRKQYDSFLEDDKKRKERNEYILGRLEKMRYSTSLVPVRHKPNILDDRLSLINYLGYQPESSSMREFQSSNKKTIERQMFPDIQVNNNENKCLIQEISKNYILIPKLRSLFIDKYVQNVSPSQNAETVQEFHPVQDTIPVKDVKFESTENTDWKSKYEILNILKNEEKQITNTNIDMEGIFKPEKDQKQVAINYENIQNADVHINTPNKYLNELPEKNMCYDTLKNHDLKSNVDCSKNDTVSAYSVGETDPYNEHHVIISNDNPADVINYKLQNIKLDNNQTESNDLSAEHYESHSEIYANMSSTDIPVDSYIKDKFLEVDPATHKHISVEQHKSADPEPVVFIDDDEINQKQTANSNGLVKDIIYSTVGVANPDAEEMKFAEAENVQEFTSDQTKTELNLNVDKIEDNMEIQPEVDPTYEIDNEAYNSKKQEETEVNVTECIEEFNEEMNYYSEETAKNLTYQQDDVAFNSDYPQNENQQNQEYAYYEGTQPAAYPVDMHDQDEMTQRYDPNYEQQYIYSEQESVQPPQQQYDQQPQQNQKPEDYKQPLPELQTLPYEQQNYEGLEEIEQVLEVEDYIEQQHVAGAVGTSQVGEAVAEQHVGEDNEIKQPAIEEIRESEQITG